MSTFLTHFIAFGFGGYAGMCAAVFVITRRGLDPAIIDLVRATPARGEIQ